VPPRARQAEAADRAQSAALAVLERAGWKRGRRVWPAGPQRHCRAAVAVSEVRSCELIVMDIMGRLWKSAATAGKMEILRHFSHFSLILEPLDAGYRPPARQGRKHATALANLISKACQERTHLSQWVPGVLL
jgi:hypothetical protein